MNWLFSTLFFANAAWALNAHRPPNTDYRTLAEKFRQNYPSDRFVSAYDAAAKDFSQLDAKSVPEEKDLTALFQTIRDHRELKDSDHGILRRLTWLYPHEGCWIRATLANLFAAQEKFARPGKLFMFGNLEAKTPNAVNGKVTWWYHVAPVIKDLQERLWVLDPAVDPKKPLTVEEELSAISPSAKAVKVALCSSYTYEPFDDCSTTEPGDFEDKAKREIGEFLYLEWDNLIELGRSPEKELGEEPPWK